MSYIPCAYSCGGFGYECGEGLLPSWTAVISLTGIGGFYYVICTAQFVLSWNDITRN